MTMSNINTLKTTAEEKYEALKMAKANNKEKIETDFHQALSAREQQVKVLRESEIASDEDKKKADDGFDAFWHTDLTQEQRNAYTEYQNSIEQATETTNTERADFMNDVSTPNFDAYKDLSSRELIYSNGFIKEIQKLALALGAENTNNWLKDSFLGGPNSLTRSRVRAIQTHLNKPPLNAGLTVDGLPGEKTLVALLKDSSEGKTIRETMIAEKVTLTPIGPDGKEYDPPVDPETEKIHDRIAQLTVILGKGHNITYNENTKIYTITAPDGEVGTLQEKNINYTDDTKTIIDKNKKLKIERNKPIETTDTKIAEQNTKTREKMKSIPGFTGFIEVTGKSGKIYYLENKIFGKNIIRLRSPSNNKLGINNTNDFIKEGDDDLKKIIDDLQNSPEAVVQLIDMATYGPGTNDELLSYLLTNIAKNDNFKEISTLYKEKKGESLYALLYDECDINSKDNYGFDEYFIVFLQYLAKKDHLKSLLLNDNIVLNELKDIKEINIYLRKNNIERSWEKGKRIQATSQH